MTLDEKINELKSLNGNLCDLESEYKNAHHSGLTWARPFEMFMEKVDGKPRFEFIEVEGGDVE